MADRHVFISHSAQDDAVGRRVCSALEQAGIPCWYSSRPSDLEPGVEWDDNIVAALDKSVAVVLLFSAAANASRWVKRELAMAEARGVPIYPIRIENVQPTAGMEAHLISVQWINAFEGAAENYLGPVISRLRAPSVAQEPVRPNKLMKILSSATPMTESYYMGHVGGPVDEPLPRARLSRRAESSDDKDDYDYTPRARARRARVSYTGAKEQTDNWWLVGGVVATVIIFWAMITFFK